MSAASDPWSGLRTLLESSLAPDADSAAPLVDELMSLVLRRHQFLDAVAVRARLEAHCARSWPLLRAARLQGVAELARALDVQLPGFVAVLDETLAGVPEVVCAEYGPELQLGVLGLALEELREPVLDVGAGRDARLVRALRAAGKDAHALDRDADPALGVRADWLEFDFGTARWGSIVSHLAFSLHFFHQHLRSEKEAGRYAHTYMRMLRALTPGGLLAYAPGLPFIEGHLDPSRHALTRRTLPPGLSHAFRRLDDALAIEVGYASRIVRL